MDFSEIYSFLRQVSTNINIIFHCLVYFLMKKMKDLFQKDKASRYRKFLFEKKNILNLNQKCQNNFQSGRGTNSTCRSRLSKCSFVKQRDPFIEANSPFPRPILFNSLF